MKKVKRINESQLNRIVAESVKNYLNASSKGKLNEGTTDERAIEDWEILKETVGAETMLDCIFAWCSCDQLAQFIEWFKEEEYL